MFEEAHRIGQAIQGGDCAAALKWCHENRSRLRKMETPLEVHHATESCICNSDIPCQVQLHMQQFVELSRRGERLEAITYARENLTPHLDKARADIQGVLGCLALGPQTTSPQCLPNEESPGVDHLLVWQVSAGVCPGAVGGPGEVLPAPRP